jgi:hypothetical protein
MKQPGGIDMMLQWLFLAFDRPKINRGKQFKGQEKDGDKLKNLSRAKERIIKQQEGREQERRQMRNG